MYKILDSKINLDRKLDRKLIYSDKRSVVAGLKGKVERRCQEGTEMTSGGDRNICVLGPGDVLAGTDTCQNP